MTCLLRVCRQTCRSSLCKATKRTKTPSLPCRRVWCGRINRFIHYVPSPQPHRSLLAYGAFSLMLESVFRCLLYRAQRNKNAAPVTSSREWLFDDANKPTKSFLTTSSLFGFRSTIHKPLEYYYYITFTKPQARNKTPYFSLVAVISPMRGRAVSCLFTLAPITGRTGPMYVAC